MTRVCTHARTTARRCFCSLGLCLIAKIVKLITAYKTGGLIVLCIVSKTLAIQVVLRLQNNFPSVRWFKSSSRPALHSCLLRGEKQTLWAGLEVGREMCCGQRPTLLLVPATTGVF